jgi:glycosyltransferase involved in cell wall biosynthesis
VAQALSHCATQPELVFLLPTNDRRIGGVCAVFDIAEALCDLGVPTAVLCAETPHGDAQCALRGIPLNNQEARDHLLAGASWLIATAHDTCATVKALARQHGCRTGYFVQGPEFSFADGAALSSVLTDYIGFDAVFAVSRFLEEIVRAHVEGEVTLVPYGPPRHKYFETGTRREERSIAVQLNGDPNKGAAFVAGVVAALVREGYRFYSFGDEALRGARRNFCTHLGFLSAAEKVKLFNRVEFYLDASNFEGLGLLLMESAHCGAIPLYRHNGGTAELLKAAGAGLEVGDYAAIGRIPKQLARFRAEADWTAERQRASAAIAGHSLEAAAAAIKEWWHAQH